MLQKYRITIYFELIFQDNNLQGLLWPLGYSLFVECFLSVFSTNKLQVIMLLIASVKKKNHDFEDKSEIFKT